PILNDKNENIGKVTSGTLSVMLNKGISLGLVEKDKFPEDKKFFIQIRKNVLEANYQAKPFHKGGHK
ncbi:MAG: glycine cleavage T C-terminal barrel domain-containing protein, partial [Bdellovibrionota bacterium]|nr:glycine cleavage T C-terminal barrel domain-containing protein [Bdellovibrionota bacterium]